MNFYGCGHIIKENEYVRPQSSRRNLVAESGDVDSIDEPYEPSAPRRRTRILNVVRSFVGNDPHANRRGSTVPDTPTTSPSPAAMPDDDLPTFSSLHLNDDDTGMSTALPMTRYPPPPKPSPPTTLTSPKSQPCPRCLHELREEALGRRLAQIDAHVALLHGARDEARRWTKRPPNARGGGDAEPLQVLVPRMRAVDREIERLERLKGEETRRTDLEWKRRWGL